jgi:hypothetical protein
MTIGFPFGVSALPSLNKGFGDLEIRWSGFRREKPTPVVADLGDLAPAYRGLMYIVIEGLVIGKGMSSATATAS